MSTNPNLNWLPQVEGQRNLVTLTQLPVFPRASRVDQDTGITYTIGHMIVNNNYTTVQLIIPAGVIQDETRRARNMNFDLVHNLHDCIYVDVFGDFTFVAQYNPTTGPTFDARLSIEVTKLHIRSEIPIVTLNLLMRANIR